MTYLILSTMACSSVLDSYISELLYYEDSSGDKLVLPTAKFNFISLEGR